MTYGFVHCFIRQAVHIMLAPNDPTSSNPHYLTHVNDNIRPFGRLGGIDEGHTHRATGTIFESQYSDR